MSAGKSHHPGWLDGAIDKDDAPGLKAALTNLHRAARRKPTEADRPPPSLFPMTPAARAAVQLWRAENQRGR